MIITRCTSCSQESPTGRIWTVLAWTDGGGTRRAYRHKLCVLCVASKLAPVWTACQRPEMSCPNCGIGTQDDYDAIYGTFIPKKVGKMEFQAPFCGSCAAHYRIWFQAGAEALEDRSLPGEGPGSGPSPTAEQTLAALGITDWHPDA